MPTINSRLRIACLTVGAIMIAPPAMAQSSASSYSYGTYNPVQAAINRNSMNDAIIKQATGKKHAGTTRVTKRKTRVRH